jgi:hypothetical protein
MRAKGKIEGKAPSPERIHTLQLLNKREDDLRSLQEAYKQKMNLK